MTSCGEGKTDRLLPSTVWGWGLDRAWSREGHTRACLGRELACRKRPVVRLSLWAGLPEQRKAGGQHCLGPPNPAVQIQGRGPAQVPPLHSPWLWVQGHTASCHREIAMLLRDL